MRTLFLFLLAAWVLPGCGGKKLELPDPPKFDWPRVPLPKAGDGKPLLIEIGGAKLALDLNTQDPITAMADCLDLVTYAVTSERSLDDAVAAARVCTSKSSSPPCCPQACVDGYAKARKDKQPPLAAFDGTFFGDARCFDDVTRLLEGKK